MWRKTDEAKPSSAGLETAAPGAANSNVTSQTAGVAATPNPSPSAPYSPPGGASASARSSSSGISRIVPGLKIDGEISGTADLYIDGEALGTIRLGGSKVTVGPNGRVQADIEARAIAVEGKVEGNLKASEGVYLGAQSRVRGSLISPRLGIEEGARVSGKVDMTRGAESRRESGGGKRAVGVTMQRVALSVAEKKEDE